MSKRRDEEETARVRRAVVQRLMENLARKGKWYSACEGTVFVKHLCANGLHLNEVIYPRNIFQLLPHAGQLYFWHEINCALNCGFMHSTYGHRTAYREWHMERMKKVYGPEAVKAWVEGAPLKPENIMHVWLAHY